MTSTTVRQDNLTANTKTSNLLAGDINEFIGQPSTVRIYASVNASGIKLSMLADSDVVVDDKELVNIKTTPSIDTSADLIDIFEVEAGTRMAVFLRETAGVSTTDTVVRMDVEPL